MSSTTQHEIFPDSLQTMLSDEERAIYHELTLLSAKIRTLDEIYYGGNTNNNNGSLEVSDDEYDALARREAELCTLYPDLLQLLENDSGLGKLATRFGGRVGQMYEEIEKNLSGSDVDDVEVKTLKPKKFSSSSVKRDKRRHLQNAPMQSLDNAMDDVQVVAWLNRIRKLLSASEKADTEGEAANDNKVAEKIPIQVIAEPKIDGLSLSLRFQCRQSDSPNEIVYDFVWGATRGDGTQGEDVTEAVQSAWMKNGIPSNSSLDDHFSVPKSFTIPTLSGNAKTVDPPLIIEIRGEVVLPQKAFDEFVENATNTANSTLRTFSNARNAASGILLRSKEPTSQDEIERTKFLQSRLQFYAYDVVSAESEPVHQHAWPWTIVGNSGLTMREFLTSIGFQIPSPVVIESLDITIDSEINVADVPNLLNYHRNFMSIRDRSEAHKQSSEMTQPTFPYKIDGVVYKLVSFHQRTVCGSSSRTPRWAIAHKFPPLSAITRLLNMEVQVGRTGALTPVAILDPVDLGGVMVARASLHNFHFARKMLLPNRATSGLSDSDEIDGKCIRVMNVKKGVSVLVSRAGDVIPQVMKRVFDDDDEEEAIDEATHSDDIISLETPRSCPACGSPTSFEFVRMPVKKKKTNSKTQNEGVSMQTMSADNEESTDAESGQVLRCSGPQLLCQPRAMNALAYAYSRPGLDVKGLSKSKLNQLFEAGIIRFPSDLFSYFGVEDEGGEGRHNITILPCNLSIIT
jgi:DNA ligase (NAD+)